MKRLFICFFIFFESFVFGQTPKSIFEIQQEEFSRLCNADKLRAERDSKKNPVYFVNIPAPGGSDFIQKKEFAELLKKDNILFGGTWMGNDIPNRYSSESCYKTEMTKLAEVKYGKKYFKEKSTEALKIYLERNPNKIFDYREDELDNTPIIVGTKSYDEQEKFIDNNFWLKYRLPKAYIRRSKDERYSNINAYFILDQNGKISNLSTEATIENANNQNFKEYFEKSFEKFIQSLSLQPQTYQGFKVKTRQNITISLP